MADALRAADRAEEFKGQSRAWIQWKGTDVCMDVRCERCGMSSHLDSEFAYFVECPGCHTRYACSPNIQLIELTPEESADVEQYSTLKHPDADDYSYRRAGIPNPQFDPLGYDEWLEGWKNGQAKDKKDGQVS